VTLTQRAGMGRLSVIACLLATLVAGCGVVAMTPPAPSPADFLGIGAELEARGLSLGRIVSGDAGCADSALTPTAISFDAKGLDQADPVRIYIYIFRNRAAFERLRASVDSCAASFITDPATFESVEESPFVVAGQGPWGADFEAALREGLTAAAGTGG
jgi:hypothetical protein